MDYASDPEGGFNALTKAFKADPSLEHYLRLRRENPDAEIEVAVLNGLGACFVMEEEFKSYGIDPLLVVSCLDADPAAMSELSLLLIENQIAAKRLADGGETHLVRRGLVIPDKMVDWLICLMLEAMSWTDEMAMNRDLIVLLRDRMGGTNPHYKQTVDAREKRQSALWLAASVHARGRKPTVRMVASALGIAPSTIVRWFPDDSFVPEYERLSVVFDEHGLPRPERAFRRKEIAQQDGDVSNDPEPAE